jgi:FAD/FMN-containing dehydrogenase
MQHADADGELGGAYGRLITFCAALLAFGGHVLLLVLITVVQLASALWRYPSRAVSTLIDPRGGQPTFQPLSGQRWNNVVGNQFTEPRWPVRSIANLQDIVQAVRDAERAQARVRAIGSGHSFSDVAVADDFLLDLRGIARVLDMQSIALRHDVPAAHLVRVESGISIRQLNRALLDRGLALHNMGGYDAQTIAGAISTGTHGSGHQLGALCDAVRSVDLVVEGGEVLRIEPHAGISDPAEHARQHPNGPRLVQSDDLFHSVVVAMGCMGVVYAYVLEVVDRYYLAERRELLDWNVLRERLLAGNFEPTHAVPGHKPVRHFEFLVNPYATGWFKKRRNCLVTYRWVVDKPAKAHKARSRNPLATVFTSIREFDDILALALNVFPRLSPFVVDSALKGLVDKLYVSESFTVLNLGDANYVPAYAAELAFGTEAVDGVPQYVRALERLFALAGEQSAQHRYHNVPISVRFIHPSRHQLAMSHGRPTAIFELPTMARVPGGWDLLRYYERRMFEEFRARPHWGQANFILGPDRVCQLYPEFARWLASYAQLCPAGTFDNSFSERLGLRTLLRVHRGQPPC